MALTLGALVLEHRLSLLPLGWLSNTLGSFTYTHSLVLRVIIIVCLPGRYIKIEILCREWKYAPSDLIAFDFEVLIEL